MKWLRVLRYSVGFDWTCFTKSCDCTLHEGRSWAPCLLMQGNAKEGCFGISLLVFLHHPSVKDTRKCFTFWVSNLDIFKECHPSGFSTWMPCKWTMLGSQRFLIFSLCLELMSSLLPFFPTETESLFASCGHCTVLGNAPSLLVFDFCCILVGNRDSWPHRVSVPKPPPFQPSWNCLITCGRVGQRSRHVLGLSLLRLCITDSVPHYRSVQVFCLHDPILDVCRNISIYSEFHNLLMCSCFKK